jgi:catechol 2,3-dioxygenase
VPTAQHLGFNVGSEEDPDKAARYFKAGIEHAFVERPYQGRTLTAVDPYGMPVELYFAMEKRERLLQRYGTYKGVPPQRLDHFNVLAPNVRGAIDFYAALGFRLTEHAGEVRPSGHIAAAWMHRKGNVHDLAFTNGRGPRLLYVRCVLRSTAAKIRRWIPIMNRSGGAYAILAGRRCGVGRRRAPGLRRAPSLPAPSRAVRGQCGRRRLGPRGGGVVRPPGAEQQQRIDR